MVFGFQLLGTLTAPPPQLAMSINHMQSNINITWGMGPPHTAAVV